MSETNGNGEDKIVPLPSGYVPPEPPASRPGLMHGAATVAMAFFAAVGFLALLAFITVGWPGRSGRYVIGVVFLAVVGFLASAAIAVFAAARDTYATRSNSPKRGNDQRN